MTQEDRLIMHKLAKEIEDYGKEIQLLAVNEDAVDKKIFEYDFRKKILAIHTCIDRLETISDYYYKVHKD